MDVVKEGKTPLGHAHLFSLSFFMNNIHQSMIKVTTSLLRIIKGTSNIG